MSQTLFVKAQPKKNLSYLGCEGYLKKDRREKFNLKRAWFVIAWRIVDNKGNDIIQPWSDTKKEALQTAKDNNIKIINI